MTQVIDVGDLRSKIFAEARRVTARADRWAAMAEQFKRNKKAFLGPAAEMKSHASRVSIAAGVCDDPYALAVLLDDLLAYDTDA